MFNSEEYFIDDYQEKSNFLSDSNYYEISNSENFFETPSPLEYGSNPLENSYENMFQLPKAPNEENITTIITENISDIEEIKKKNDYLKKTNSSEKTDSSTEKNKPNKPNKPNKSKVFEIIKVPNKKLLGKKRANDTVKKEKKPKKDNSQAGFRDDNIFRKIQTKLFDSFTVIINKSLKENQTKNSPNYSLLKINQKIIEDIRVNHINILLPSKLKDIYSNENSTKYKNYGMDLNRQLIDKTYAEKNKIKTMKILDKTFFECLEHFRGTKYYPELAGLEEEYQKVIKDLKMEKTEEYINKFIDTINTFEKKYQNKKSRYRKKKWKKFN